MTTLATVRCAHCGSSASNIYTHCPSCGVDTGGYAECVTCRETIYQLDFWKSGNACPSCREHARELPLLRDQPKKRSWFQRLYQRIRA